MSSSNERRFVLKWLLFACCIVLGNVGFLHFGRDGSNYEIDEETVTREDIFYRLRRLRPLPSSAALRKLPSPLQRKRLEHPPDRQKVYFIAGPHKTSSSSIQLNLYHWLKSGESAQLSHHFAWPSPSSQFIKAGCDMNEHLESKIFYPWVEAIKSGQKKHRCLRYHYSREEVLEMYRVEFDSEWIEKKKSLVIASEAMDFIASQRYRNPEEILRDMVQEMPWNRHGHSHVHPLPGHDAIMGEDKDITAVVNYRTARSSHLVSMWHQCCMNDMSFYQYLTEQLGAVVDPIRSLDSLYLAQSFVHHGMHVELVDMSGISVMGYDVSNVIACDILGASCTENKQLSDVYSVTMLRKGKSKKTPTTAANVRMHSEANFNVTNLQLERIDKAIRMYDCNFASLLNEEGVRILYGYDLLQIFDDCQDYDRGKIPHTRHELVQRIIMIALEADNVLDDDDYYLYLH